MTLPVYIETHREDVNRITFWAVELAFSSPQRITNAPYPITVGGNVYTPAVLSVEGIQTSETDPTAVAAALTIASGGPADYWQSVLAALAGNARHPVVYVHEAWLDPTGLSAVVQSSRLMLTGRLESASWDLLEARLTIGPVSDPTILRLPFREFTVPCSYRKFKGAQCGYAGAGAECDRLYPTCTAFSNQARYGGLRYPTPESVTIEWQWANSAGTVFQESLTLTQRD